MQGTFIVIEGTDGSGKATQTTKLVETLRKEGRQVEQLSFPCYGTKACGQVEMYLSGAFGAKPNDVNAYAASMFYAIDRFASYKTGWGKFLDAGGIVVADRYTTANMVHQCAKLPQEEWDTYLDWLYDLEFVKMGLPIPTKVIFLDMDPDASQKMMTGRYSGHEERKDIHEKDVAYMRCSRKAGIYCAKKYGWTHIKCDNNGSPRGIEDIAADIRKALKNKGETKHGL